MTKQYYKRNKLINGYRTIDHPLYLTYNNMKQRCYVIKNNPSYKYYGGRGIKIDEEWNTFEKFALDMYPTWDKKLTIERINNDHNYNKKNCKWATHTEQCLNRRVFKNNKCKTTGIYIKNNRYIVHYTKEHIHYHLGGSFSTLQSAINTRNTFIHLLNTNKTKALQMLQRPARYDSLTKIKGISKTKKAYIVRITHNKKRIYLGYFLNLKTAKQILNDYKTKHNLK